jgi:hypothetical protein
MKPNGRHIQGGKVSTDDKYHAPSWHRYRPQPQRCPIQADGCEKTFILSGSRSQGKTCPNPKCMAEHKRLAAKARYQKNPDKHIAQSRASRRRRHIPVFKECQAPHPTKPGELCGNKFEVKTVGDGRRLTCSDECSVRRRWALQRDRYQANLQAKRDYHNARYADKIKKPVGKARCPNPACGREYDKWRTHQPTCGRSVCHQWQYSQTHQDQINERKRRKRRDNPIYAAHDREYQRNYRANNQETFKGYRPKINENQRRRRAAARQAAIEAGTFVDRRTLGRKITEVQRARIIKRRKAGEPLKSIAKSYGVSISHISNITNKKQKA